METNRPKAVAYTPKRAALNWVDYLVIAAAVLTFTAVVAANNPHTARAQTRSSVLSESELPVQISEAPGSSGLIKARIGLTAGM